MRLTVLGCRAGSPADGQPSSGYLVDTGTTRILLDCGPGIAAALSALVTPGSLDAVVVSHLHYDHCHDLLPLGKSLLAPLARYPGAPGGPGQPAEMPLVPLYVPADARSTLLAWASLFTVDTIPLLNLVFNGAFEVREYQAGDVCAVGDASLVFHELRHAKPNCGVRVTAPHGSLAYTGDTGVCDGLTRLAAGVDLLLAEASLDHTDHGVHGHLSAADAATAAAAAGAGELVLTHFPTAEETVLKARVAEAARLFPRRVSAAFPGASFVIGA
ncbi:MAG TPA: MBL fold metallo-hydrolase [Trebonia sp.]|nr:MBL fold metallo-hydrolase [Trebonia sp.]